MYDVTFLYSPIDKVLSYSGITLVGPFNLKTRDPSISPPLLRRMAFFVALGGAKFLNTALVRYTCYA